MYGNMLREQIATLQAENEQIREENEELLRQLAKEEAEKLERDAHKG